MNDLPIAVIQHPLGGIPAAEVQRRAEAAVDQIVSALSRASAQPVPAE